MRNMAVFASGAGSNAHRLIGHFADSTVARVALVVCNKQGAGVLGIAAAAGVPVLMIEKDRFFNGDAYVPELHQFNIEFIILAGFLWKVPGKIVRSFPGRIVNIHPALLPKFGGKGMYGERVHQAVLDAKETQSGITIHYVNEVYDDGETIFQARCEVDHDDTARTLAAKVHQLEHAHYPRVIENLVRAFPSKNS